MTFYWWSHWFWITLLSVVLLPFASICVVHTYPSQEPSGTAVELNQNGRTASKGHGDASGVTKLYQTNAESGGAQVALPSSTPLSLLGTESAESEGVAIAGRNKLLGRDTFAAGRSGGGRGGAAVRVNDDADPEATTGEGSVVALMATEYKRSAEQSNHTGNREATAQQSDAQALNTNADIGGSTAASAAVSADVSSANAKNNSDNNNTARAEAAAAPPATPQIDASALEQQHYNNNNNNNNSNRANITTIITTTTTATSSRAASTTTTTATVTIGSDSGGGGGAGSAAAVGERVPFTLENANKAEELRRAESEQRNARKSKVLSAEYKHNTRFINYSGDTTKSVLARSAAATASNAADYDAAEESSNISSEALAVQRTYFLDAGAISAICLTVFGVCCAVGTLGIVLYRRRYANKPQALSEPDSSVYIDDSTMRVSDNSDEMYSLDNDSFLNSLEAMTIQNYWTDTVKHTKL